MKKVLVTGTAGFIGFHLTKRLLEEGFQVLGLDVINDYYDIKLKYARLAQLGILDSQCIKNKICESSSCGNFRFLLADLADHEFIVDMMTNEKFSYVVNLAAQAGVRYSIENPRAYTHSNIDGFLSILEGARQSEVKHLIYASTSSVYGLNSKLPFCESVATEHPMAFYAATKKANEMMAHSYSHLYRIPMSGLRFFTVYGPWGRPDMALFLFTDSIRKGKKINVFNNGQMIRDFTYVDDIVESIRKLLPKPPMSNPEWDSDNPEIDSSSAPYRIFNIGNGAPVLLGDYIAAIEDTLGIKAKYNLMGMQPGDVAATHADTKALEKHIGFKPRTSVREGISKFISWYLDYYR